MDNLPALLFPGSVTKDAQGKSMAKQMGLQGDIAAALNPLNKKTSFVRGPVLDITVGGSVVTAAGAGFAAKALGATAGGIAGAAMAGLTIGFFGIGYLFGLEALTFTQEP